MRNGWQGQKNYANGFELALHQNVLELPLSWKKPQTIFVNSMSDLFLEEIPVEFIKQVFDVMQRATRMYEPDFVAETFEGIYLVEIKMDSQMQTPRFWKRPKRHFSTAGTPRSII